MTPLDEILEAAGIPQDATPRVLARRDGHRVITSPGFPTSTLTINGKTYGIENYVLNAKPDPLPTGPQGIAEIAGRSWISAIKTTTDQEAE